MTLYNITSDYIKLMELAEDPEIPADVLADTFDALDGEFEEKAEACAKVMREMENESESIANEIARLKARKDAVDNGRDRIKKNLQFAMNVTGKRKFRTSLFSFGIQKNPASVVMDTESIVDIDPAFLIAQAPKIDKKGILQALKNGEELDFAHLEQGESLRIR